MKKSIGIILALAIAAAPLRSEEVVRDSLGFRTGTAISVLDLLEGCFTDRGTSSLYIDNTPVAIIDGVISSIDFLNPSDVEDIRILKNASETAKYGVYGANGILLISTRTGEGNRRRIRLDSNFGTDFRHGLSHNHYLSVSESLNNTSYNFSGAFRKSAGSTVIDNGSVHAGFRSSAGKSIGFGFDVLVNCGNSDIQGDHDDKTGNYGALASSFLRIRLLPSLYFKADVGMDTGYGRRNIYFSPETETGAVSDVNENGGAATNVFSKHLGFNGGLSLTYDRYINSVHHLGATLSADVSGYNDNTNTMNASNFVVQILRAKSFNVGVYPVKIDNISPKYTHFGAVAGLTYDYKSVFGIDASIRADETYKYYYDGLNLYPAVSAWANVGDWFSLSAGYGESGREMIYPYEIAAGMMAGESYTPKSGTFAFHEGLGNLRVREFHAGATTSRFGGRLTAGLTWFSRKGSESLAICQIGAPYSNDKDWSFGGCAKRYERTSGISNCGLEAVAKGRILEKKELSWDISARASYIRNRIFDVNDSDFFAAELEPGEKYIINSRNLPVGTILGYRRNEDGSLKDITGEGDITKADMVVLGCAVPEFRYSLESVLKWRSLSFELLAVKESDLRLREAAASYKIPLRPSALRGLSLRLMYSDFYYKSLTLGASLEF